MSKESILHQDKRVIFHEPFIDEQHIIRNSGELFNNPTINNGICSIVAGDSQKIEYSNIDLSGRTKFTLRIKGTFGGSGYTATAMQFIDATHRVGIVCISGVFYFFTNASYCYFNLPAGEHDVKVVYYGGGATSADRVKMYLDSTVQSLTFSGNIETSITQFSGEPFQIGVYHNITYTTADYELVTIYDENLNAYEVSNLFNNSAYKELSTRISSSVYKILDVHSLNGALKDEMNNTLTPTNVDIVKRGKIWSPSFNKVDSKIDCGIPDNLTGDLTILAWLHPKSYGEIDNGSILKNGKFGLQIYSDGRFYVLSDGSSTANSDAVVNLEEMQLIMVHREADGTTTFYNADNEDITNDSTSGTPAAGDTNLTVGNTAAQSNTWDGFLSRTIVYKGLLTREQLSQFYTSTKANYNK